jgi:hypothetical protein
MINKQLIIATAGSLDVLRARSSGFRTRSTLFLSAGDKMRDDLFGRHDPGVAVTTYVSVLTAGSAEVEAFAVQLLRDITVSKVVTPSL